MSMRRFCAYFLAIAAGSTAAFAYTLKEPPLPQGAVIGESGMILTAADTGTDGVSPEAARLFQELQGRSRRNLAAKIAQVELVKSGIR